MLLYRKRADETRQEHAYRDYHSCRGRHGDRAVDAQRGDRTLTLTLTLNLTLTPTQTLTLRLTLILILT